MAQMIQVEQKDWQCEETEGERFRFCRELELGNILFFPSTPFVFPPEEIEFLLQQQQGRSRGRKNIAYKPISDRITNHKAVNPEHGEQMRAVLRNYSTRVTAFLTRILAPYAPHLKHDYASFRPFQERGRKLRLRARNDLLHVDAFPTRPIHGARILRFFTNINPTESRHWITSKPFDQLAEEFAGTRELPFPRSAGYSLSMRLTRKMKEYLCAAGVKIPLRSPYDTFMLEMHNFLKEHKEFQETCPKDHWQFPPGSCWAVFTDQVSHAALAGRYALEQTFLVPQGAMLYPELAPISVLERLSGGNMIDPHFASKSMA